MIIRSSVSLLVVLFKVTFHAEICEGTESGVFFREGLKGRRLENSLLRKVSTLSIVECSLQCLRERCCQSVNYGKNLNTIMEHDCELNDGKASANPEDITRNDSYIHYEILDTGNGFRGEPCIKALGSTKDLPGKSCKDIKQHTNTSISKEYWIKPSSTVSPFLVSCEMTLYGGGWTLVYSYTFTNYSKFYDSSNAVIPCPNWRAPAADVKISTTPPLKDKFGAIEFDLWQQIGVEFFIRSNINDWYKCKPNVGRLVNQTDGSISCEHAEEIAGNCNKTGIPTQIMWEDNGPVLKDSVSIYRFDGSTSKAYPTHNSCTGGTKNHKRGVANPYGQIFIK